MAVAAAAAVPWAMACHGMLWGGVMVENCGKALSSAADGDVIIQISLPPKLTAMCKMNQSSPHSPAKSATCKCHA